MIINNIHPKLRGINPERILCIFDYDKTMAAKLDPNDTDHSPLLPHHYEGLCRLSEAVGRLIILTARGEESTLKYLGEHIPKYGRLPNTTVASNSGYLYHQTDLPRAVKYLSVPDLPDELRPTVVAKINTLAARLRDLFPAIKTDSRELCAAAIFQFEGTEAHTVLLDQAEKLREQFNRDLEASYGISNAIRFSKNDWPVDYEGGTKTMGYIDILPDGLRKGGAIETLYGIYRKCIMKKTGEEPVVVCGGDSSADFEFMRGLAEMRDPENSSRLLIDPDNLLCLSVGPDLQKYDEEYAALPGGRPLLDVTFTGTRGEPVNKFHTFIATIGSEDLRAGVGRHYGATATPTAYAYGGGR